MVAHGLRSPEIEDPNMPDETTIPASDTEQDEKAWDHECEIVERILSGIWPSELPPDVRPSNVAYLLWDHLTEMLTWFGFTADELAECARLTAKEEIEEARRMNAVALEDLGGAPPAGSA
jgi:hypothetical protein